MKPAAGAARNDVRWPTEGANARGSDMLGPFNHVPRPRDKAEQKVALSVLLVVLALYLLITGLSVALPPAGAELPAQPDRYPAPRQI